MMEDDVDVEEMEDDEFPPPVVRPWMELMPVAHGAEFEII